MIGCIHSQVISHTGPHAFNSKTFHRKEGLMCVVPSWIQGRSRSYLESNILFNVIYYCFCNLHSYCVCLMILSSVLHQLCLQYIIKGSFVLFLSFRESLYYICDLSIFCV
eukprot:377702_1